MTQDIETPQSKSGETEGQPSLGQRDRNPNLRWYVVHTYSMFEEKAKSALLDRIKLNITNNLLFIPPDKLRA